MQGNGVKVIRDGSYCGGCENIQKAGTCLRKQPFYLNIVKIFMKLRCNVRGIVTVLGSDVQISSVVCEHWNLISTCSSKDVENTIFLKLGLNLISEEI